MPQNLIKTDINGKPTVDTKNAFILSVSGSLPTGDWNYKAHLDQIQKSVLDANHRVTSGAISNCRGTWYEWMLAIDLYNEWCNAEHDYLMVPLPNISRFDCATLYVPEVSKFIFDLRRKLHGSLDIELITSNPDFVMFDTSELFCKSDFEPISCVTPSTIEFIDNFFRQLVGKCKLDDIVAYMATKTSLRPDRRLQIVHEGSLTKAMYVHLQTRLWIDKPRKIKYFGASLSLNEKDRIALKTVATHSITTILSEPEKAVDECFELSSRDLLYTALSVMHESILPRTSLEP